MVSIIKLYIYNNFIKKTSFYFKKQFLLYNKKDFNFEYTFYYTSYL